LQIYLDSHESEAADLVAGSIPAVRFLERRCEQEGRPLLLATNVYGVQVSAGLKGANSPLGFAFQIQTCRS
jgi:hypothetical protein